MSDDEKGYTSFSLAKELGEAIKVHLERSSALLGRPTNRIAPFMAEAARHLMDLDMQRMERILRLEEALSDEDARDAL